VTVAVKNYSPYGRPGRHRCTRPRTLHLVDVENLVSGDVSAHLVRQMWAEFVDVLGVRWNDHSTVAVSRRNAATAFLALPSGLRRVVGADGPDGADLALIESVDVDWAAAHFGQVVIASGDHIFAPLANRLRARGIPVVQVIGGGKSSAQLYLACTDHKYLAQTRATTSRCPAMSVPFAVQARRGRPDAGMPSAFSAGSQRSESFGFAERPSRHRARHSQPFQKC
jgi:hypothetical protein